MQCVLLLQISNMSLLSKYIRISNTRLAPVHSCVLEYPTHSLTYTPVIGGTIYQCSFSDCDCCDFCNHSRHTSVSMQSWEADLEMGTFIFFRWVILTIVDFGHIIYIFCSDKTDHFDFRKFK